MPCPSLMSPNVNGMVSQMVWFYNCLGGWHGYGMDWFYYDLMILSNAKFHTKI